MSDRPRSMELPLCEALGQHCLRCPARSPGTGAEQGQLFRVCFRRTASQAQARSLSRSLSRALSVSCAPFMTVAQQLAAKHRELAKAALRKEPLRTETGAYKWKQHRYSLDQVR